MMKIVESMFDGYLYHCANIAQMVRNCGSTKSTYRLIMAAKEDDVISLREEHLRFVMNNDNNPEVGATYEVVNKPNRVILNPNKILFYGNRMMTITIKNPDL